jgi:hypothetical protein
MRLRLQCSVIIGWHRICVMLTNETSAKRHGCCMLSSGIDSKESIAPLYVALAGIFKQSMGARNRVGIGLSYRPARLHRLAEFIPWNQFLGSINV